MIRHTASGRHRVKKATARVRRAKKATARVRRAKKATVWR